MTTLTVYPRGYTSGPVDAPAREASFGDLLVDTLYDYSKSYKGHLKNWKYYGQVLDLALAHFGDFHTWLDMQLGNPLIGGSRRDFLLETVAFIQGQSRTVHFSSWIFMLDSIDANEVPRLKIQRRFESSQFLSKELTTIQVLQQWCSRPDGIHDLLQSMHVLFGHAASTPA